MNSLKIDRKVNCLKTGTVVAVLLLFVTVISCNQDVTGSADEDIQSAQITTSANVDQCDTGSFSTNGVTCEPCPVGTYQDEPGQTSCKIAEYYE